MRGKEGEFMSQEPEKRITPAHAGKSFHFGNVEKRIKDHPRACGEK